MTARQRPAGRLAVVAAIVAAESALAGAGLEEQFDPSSVHGFRATVQSRGRLRTGWHVFEAEYRTEGLAAMGAVRAQVNSADGKRSLSGNEHFPAASDWSLLRLYFRLERPERILVRFGDAKAGPGASSAERRLRVRSLKAVPFELKRGVELLGNGSFSFGSPSELPALWWWKYNRGNPGDYRLVEDKTFRAGDQVMRITSDGGGKWRALVSKLMPLPTGGRLTFTFWARSNAPGSVVKAYLFGDRWKWQWQVTGAFPLTNSWQKYTCNGPCPAEIKQEPTFWARFDYGGEGHVDLAGASVTWEPYGLAKAAKAKEPTDDPASEWIGTPGKNLLLNPDFELGWTGWVTDQWVKSVKATVLFGNVEPTRPEPGQGMDGGTAFYMTQGTALRAYCVPIEKGRTYTLSAYFKSAKPGGTVWWAFLEPAWQMYADSIKSLPTGRWERRSFTFKWEKPSKQMRAYVRINSGDVLVDRVQLEKGPLSDYEAPPVMLGLTPVKPEDTNIFVRGTGAARLTFKAIPSSAVTERFKARLVARNAWKKTVWEKEYGVDPGGTFTETIDLPVDELGTFVVELKAYGRDEEVIGIGMARYAVIDPPAEEVGDESMFGLCYAVMAMPAWRSELDVKEMNQLGVRWNRFFFKHNHKTLVPPRDYIAAIRKQVAPLKRSGIRLIGCINVFPKRLAEKIVGLEKPDPAALREYGEHVKALVAALQDDIRYWEIMNEPNLWRYGKGPLKGERSVPPEKYIEILKVAYRAVKDVDRGLKVVGCCTNGTGFDWFERCMELGSGRYMDIYSFHSYRTSPDMPDVYPDLMKLRGILDKHGFRGPMMNTEQYFAANLFTERGSDEETRRGYYVRGDEELRAAGRTIRNYIHHVAAGAPYCAFAPGGTLCQHGGGDPVFPYYLFAAYNAATRILGSAGRGEPLEVGASLRVFVFPRAEGGPLVTVHSPSAEIDGRMKLRDAGKGAFAAYDIMGNRLSAAEIEKGIPVRTDPCYIRYPRGTRPLAQQIREIKEALIAAEVMGLGDPFAVQVSLSGEKQLVVSVSNRHNRSLGGRVVLQDVPAGWTTRRKERSFADLEPGRTERMEFRFDTTDVKNLGSYPVTVLVESGEEFVRQQAVLSPLFARSLRRVRVDGDLSEWRRAEWVDLGGDRLSKDFDPRLERTGDADLSARLACGWSRDFFALALEVTDDRHVPGDLALEAWKGDSLQIYFDQKNNASAWIGGQQGYDSDDIVYTVSLIRGSAVAYLEKAGSERYIGQANLSRGVDKDVDVAVVRRGGKTVYEVSFPKRTLPDVELRDGRGFGFSLLVNDNDGKGRKVGLTLAPEGKEPYMSPHEFRDLLLVR